MAKEIELKVIGIDKKQAERRLSELRAKHVASYDFRRVVFDISDGKTARYVRVRTDGTSATITLKERKGTGLDMTDEYETGINDFNTAVKILCKVIKSAPIYEINKREEYMLNGVQVAIDKWPEIPWYIEIEGPSVSAVRATYKKLGIKGKQIGNITHGAVYMDYYDKDYMKIVERNRSKLDKIVKSTR